MYNIRTGQLVTCIRCVDGRTLCCVPCAHEEATVCPVAVSLCVRWCARFVASTTATIAGPVHARRHDLGSQSILREGAEGRPRRSNGSPGTMAAAVQVSSSDAPNMAMEEDIVQDLRKCVVCLEP